MTYTIKGLPPTTNASFKCGRGRFYQSDAYKQFKDYVRLSLRPKRVYTTPVYLSVTFFYVRDRDIDNLKCLLDSFNGILYEDDALIQELKVIKVKTTKSRVRTVVTVSGTTRFVETV